MQMAASIGGLEGAYDYTFRRLSHRSLKKVAGMVIPPISLSLPPTKMRNEIIRYVERNTGKASSRFYPELTRIILSEVSRQDLSSDLDEPRKEEELKPVIRRAMTRLGFKPHDKEVSIPPATRADMVGYKTRRERHVERDWRNLWRKKEEREKWYELLGVELKTAKRTKDPVFRQALFYAQYFDHTFTVVTPLTLLVHGYKYFSGFCEDMKTKGVGFVLATRHQILGTILRSQDSSPPESNRRHVCREIGLRR